MADREAVYRLTVEFVRFFPDAEGVFERRSLSLAMNSWVMWTRS